MPREYYVDENGTPMVVAGNNEYATQIPMSASDSTDVATKIQEVNSSTQWVGVDVKTGNNAITLPSNWTELYVLCQYGNSSAIQAQCVETVIIRNAYDNTRVYTFGGATLFAQVKFTSTTSISMIAFNVSGGNYTSTSQIRVYAKTA